MTRRLTKTIVIVGMFLVGPGGMDASAAPSATNQPYNVLMIIIDVAANLHSVKNKGPLRTPNIERLASRGTWFARAYNDAPVCCGSRTALLTGVHAARSGVYYNTQPYRRAGTWISRAQTLPAAFL